MGINGAKSLIGVGVLSVLLVGPAFAQDDDIDTSTSSANNRADSSSDPDSDVDRSITDRAGPSERDDADIDRPAVLRDDKKTTPKRKLAVRVRLLDIDSDLDTDDGDNNRGDNIDRDGIEDQDKPKTIDKKKQDATKKDATKKDVTKKDVTKKDASKADAPKADAPKKDAPAKDTSAKKPGDCVDVKSEARFSGLGYDHLVTLKSTCKKRMQCVVRTNVNPEPASVTLEPGEEETVLTWRGSPAREFTPDVKCE